MGYILVTGCNGFIGSKLTQTLLNRGYKVLGISYSKSCNIVGKNFKYISVNLNNCLTIEKIFRENNISKVIHLAAIAHVKKGQKVNWNSYYRVNTLASKTIFECSIKAEAKIFFASSIDVYGASKERKWTEDIAPIPVSLYGKSKYLAEQYLQDLYGDKGNYTIGRFAPVYSDKNKKDVYKRIYVKFPNFAMVLATKPYYTLLSIENLVNFIAKWVENNNIEKNIINICDKDSVSAEFLINNEKKEGRAKYIIKIPYLISWFFSWVSNKLLYSHSKADLGFTLTKLFDPREIPYKL